MATITPPRRSDNLAQVHERVRSPLDRLRKYIRVYVWLEGAAVFMLFLALWFWIGLLLDYGSFKLFNGLDWVRVLPWWIRLSLLVVLSGTAAALVAFKVVRRLFKEFKDAALALLLERRFPDLLGDRLITAVELSDPDACAALGFSPAMIRETIHEAAERVEKVPVREVFDWRRLILRGLAVVLLTVVAAGAAFGGFALFAKTARHGVYQFRNIAAIWFERNILLKNVYWPRRAHLILEEPSAAHLRIARDDPAPVARVLALRYVLADTAAPEGWRALTWQDLEDRPDLIGSDLPGKPPGDWTPAFGDSITLDEVEVHLNSFDVRQEADGKKLAAKWNIADKKVESGWRPLRWSDLKPEHIGGFAVPTLSASWDNTAGPINAAMIFGLGGSGPSFAPLQAAVVARIGPIFQDAELDAIETRLAKIVEDGITLHFHGKAIHFIQGDVVQRFSPLTVPGAAVASLGLGGYSGAALLNGFAETKSPRESKEVGLAYIFSRLERLTALRGVIEKVAERAADPAMGRTLRELVLPREVYLHAAGANNTTSVTLKPNGDNTYSGTFKDLKVETTSYYAEAEDAETEKRLITVLPPPALDSLICYQSHPAYLYYRPEMKRDELIDLLGIKSETDLKAELKKLKTLKGVKQKMTKLDFSSTSGSATRITQVPAGSDVVLEGSINKTFKNSSKSLKAGDPPALQVVARGGSILNYTDLSWDGKEFKVAFKDVRERQEFTFIFFDVDGVKGQRQMEISTKPDAEPAIESFEPEIVRKTPEGYKITASARIPFRGVVMDGQGLARVRYAWTVERDEIGSAGLKAGTAMIFGLTLKLPVEPEAPISAADTRYRTMPQFLREMLPDLDVKGPGSAFLTPERRADMLKAVQDPGFRTPSGRNTALLSRFTIKPDDWIHPLNPTEARTKWKYPDASDETKAPLYCDFPVYALDLKEAANKVQKHYKLRLWVEAVDTDVDSDADKDGTPKPHVFSTNRFTFRIVSESVLLSEIAREEDEQRKKFLEMFENLQNREIKLIEICSMLDRGAFKDPELPMELQQQLNGMVGSLAVTSSQLEKAKEVVINVRKDYERILKELRINQVETGSMIARVNTGIVEPLLQAEATEFPEALKAIAEFSNVLREASKINNVRVDQITTESRKNAAKTAQIRIQELKDKLRTVLDAMDKISGLNELIRKLVEIESSEKAQEELYQRLKDELIRKELEGLDPKKP